MWQLTSFWHEFPFVRSKVDADVEFLEFEKLEMTPPVLVSDTDADTQRLVHELLEHKRGFEHVRASAAYNELDTFWLRKSKQPVLSVVTVQKTGEPVRFFRGLNMEVSLPTGSLCSERSAIASALTSDPSIVRKDIRMIAVLAMPLTSSKPPAPSASDGAAEAAASVATGAATTTMATTTTTSSSSNQSVIDPPYFLPRASAPPLTAVPTVHEITSAGLSCSMHHHLPHSQREFDRSVFAGGNGGGGGGGGGGDPASSEPAAKRHAAHRPLFSSTRGPPAAAASSSSSSSASSSMSSQSVVEPDMSMSHEPSCGEKRSHADVDMAANAGDHRVNGATTSSTMASTTANDLSPRSLMTARRHIDAASRFCFGDPASDHHHNATDGNHSHPSPSPPPPWLNVCLASPPLESKRSPTHALEALDMNDAKRQRVEKEMFLMKLRKEEKIGVEEDRNPIAPCGACNEWLKKIAEVNPDFKVVTFTSAACQMVFIKSVHM